MLTFNIKLTCVYLDGESCAPNLASYQLVAWAKSPQNYQLIFGQAPIFGCSTSYRLTIGCTKELVSTKFLKHLINK